MESQLLPEVLERIDRIEAHNRRWKFSVLIGMILTVVALGIPPTSSSPVPTTDRIRILETKVAALSKRVVNLETVVNAIPVPGNGSESMQPKLDSLDFSVESLEDEVKKSKDDIDELQSRVSSNDNSTEVDDLQDKEKEMESFRTAICSLFSNSGSPSAYLVLHTGYPVPCPSN